MKKPPREILAATLAYQGFTLTDGALRMVVLLHLAEQGLGPLAIASLFLWYEAFGVVTNAAGGWLGSKLGLRHTLIAGLLLQVLAFLWLGSKTSGHSVAMLAASQALSGIAKDLTKMSAKSYLKFSVSDGDRRGLLRWVAWVTGSKNALKGLGFFMGAALLASLGFAETFLVMAIGLALILVASFFFLGPDSGRSPKVKAREAMVSEDARINWLAAARLFLFASRDVWFVLALPLFLAQVFGWSRPVIGATLAAWVIGYGLVQSASPKLLERVSRDGEIPNAGALAFWTALLLLPGSALALAIVNDVSSPGLVLAALAAFGIVFAFNSAIHSYLIVDYAPRDRIAVSVGFYYAANASGRLVGTLLSGWLFQAAGQEAAGLAMTLAAASVLVLASLACTPGLRRAEKRAELSL